MLHGETTQTPRWVGNPRPLNSVQKVAQDYQSILSVCKTSNDNQAIVWTVNHLKLIKPWRTSESPEKVIKVWRPSGLAV